MLLNAIRTGITTIAPVIAGMMLTHTCLAQSPSNISAFSTCFDANGNPGLCTLQGVDLAEGYSASIAGAPATLATRTFTIITLQEACAQVPRPGALHVRLLTSDFRVGDRILFEDFSIEAVDENGFFLPYVPIRLTVLAPPAMITARSDWEFVEIAAVGTASFLARLLCDDFNEVAGETSITVNP